MKKIIHLTLNGEPRELLVSCHRTLLDTLRHEAGLTGAKKGCDVGECGSCTIIMDGKLVNACLVLAPEADGAEIITIEGIRRSAQELHPLQENFIKYGAAQCGFCTPGFILAAKMLLEENPRPTVADIRFAMAGNICRCTGYTKIIEAVEMTARQLQAGAEEAV
jgi:carbon-monoxide dehydrogenase small subunit